jgi:hypothetical protein
VHRVVVVVASRAPLRAGYLDCLILVRKSDLPKFFIPKIEEIRNKFQGDHKDHIVFRELQIDGAGEQVSHNIEALLNDVKGGAVETILTDPRRKESAAMIEARVKRSEIGTKTMMLETSMPADEWDYSMLAHIWLSRRVPRQKDIRSRTARRWPTAAAQLSPRTTRRWPTAATSAAAAKTARRRSANVALHASKQAATRSATRAKVAALFPAHTCADATSLPVP